MKIKLSSFLILHAFLTLQAQGKIWEIDLRDRLFEVGWIEQANDGTIIAAVAKGLMALDNNTGETRWHKPDLKSIDNKKFLNQSNHHISCYGF